MLQQLADGSMQDVAIALQGTSATALDAFQAGVADAYSNSVPLASSTSSIIGELATALDAKLAYVQHLDPDSTKVLSESMSLITDALNEALEAGSSRVAEQTTQGIAAYLQNLNFQLKEADSASAIMHALHSFVPPMGNGSQGANHRFELCQGFVSFLDFIHHSLATCRADFYTSGSDLGNYCHCTDHGWCAIR